MYGAEGLAVPSFLLCFPFVCLFHRLCWNQHVTTLLHFSFFFFLIIFLTCYHFTFHQHHFISATRVSMVTTFVLINLWSLGCSPLDITSVSFMLTSSSLQLTCYHHIKVFFYIPLVWWTCDLWDLHTLNVISNSSFCFHCILASSSWGVCGIASV